MTRYLLSALTSLCLSAFSAHILAQDSLGWDPKIQAGKLSNGLRYLSFDARQDPELSEQQRTHVQLIVHAGASDEAPAQHGVAHMLEHMVFHATEQYPDGARQALYDLGLEQGGSFNAVTNADVTRYMLTLPDAEPDTLTQALTILKEMVFKAQLNAQDFATEKPIVLEEWRSKLSDRQSLNQAKKAIIHHGSDVTERPIIGTQASIVQMPRDSIKAFYDAWYQPNNISLVVMGPQDRQQVAKLIKQTFADVPNQALPARAQKDPELKAQLKLAELVHPTSRLNRIAWLHRIPSVHGDDPDTRRHNLINYLTLKLLSQQIERQAERNDSHLSVTKAEVSANVDVVAIADTFAEGQRDQQLGQLFQEVARIQAHGFYTSDFEHIRERTKQTAQRNIEAAQSRGIFWLAKLIEAAAKQQTLPDPKVQNQQTLKLLDTITLDEVNQRMQAWFSAPDQILYQQLAGNNSHTPALKNAQVQALQNAVPDKLAAPQPASETKLPRLVADTQAIPAKRLTSQPELGVSHWQLANGDQVWLLDQSHWPAPASDRVQFRAISDFGYHNSLFSDTYSQLLAQLMAASTTPTWSADEQALWRKTFKVQSHWSQTQTERQFNATVRAQDLAALLAFYQQSQHITRWQPDAYKSFQDTLTRQLNPVAERPSALFKRQFNEQHFAQSSTKLERQQGLQTFLDTDQLTLLKQARTLQQRPVQYLVAADQVERLLPLLNRYLGAIKREPSAAIRRSVTTPASGKREFELAAAQVPRSQLTLKAFTPLAWQPNYTAVIPHLADELYRQLKAELRGQQQGVYSLSADIRYDLAQQGVELSVDFSTAPERLERMRTAMNDVLEHWQEQITPAWIKAQQGHFIKADRARMEAPEAIFNRLSLSLQQYGDARYLAHLDELPEAFNSDNLEALLQALTWPSQTLGILTPAATKQ
ncbi:M16 family metallopeptidase [Marinomonas ostreistagni]|uniref:M16 family metallopeptidase n=1 Tax=Marinomonas ostreistagni TaxID=359209 RepID=UPI0019507416|nr:insulinase family protein [Marinomonas ostreistagni]MBM6551077.1 insulinase family protein [Marinomonas ostreistagni]